MSEQDEEQLAIKIIAKISDLEKQMKRAEAVTTKTYDAMQRGSTRATQRMEADMIRSTTRINQAVAQTSGKVGDFGKAFAVGLSASTIAAGVAMLALGAVIEKTKQALDEFGDIADKSAASGLDAEFFQELAYQASLGGVAIDQLSGALNTFNKNSGLAVVNKGKMVQALKVLNPELLESIRNARSQEERVKLVADAIDKEADASRKAAIASAAFGDAGAKLVNVFNGGSAAIAETAAKARKLGIIIDNEVIARADELGDQFDTATKAIDIQFKQSLVNLAPILTSTAGLIADITAGMAGFIDYMRAYENQTTKLLNIEMFKLGQEQLDIETQILKAKQEQREEVEKMSDTAKNLGFDETQNPVLPGDGAIDALNAKLEKNLVIQKQITEVLNARNKADKSSGSSNTSDNDLPPPPPPKLPSRNAAAEDAVRQAAAVKDLIENLRIESEQVGMSEVEIAKANALRQAGAAATQEQRARIIDLIETAAREKEANDRLKETMEELKSTTSSFVTSFRQGLMNGQSAAESFKGAVLQMADTIMQKLESMAADKVVEGLFGNLLGGLGGAGGGIGGLLGGSATAKAVSPASAATAKSINRANASSGAASAGQPVDIRVSVDDDGKVKAYVERSSQKTLKAANAISKAGLDLYRRGQFHDDFEGHVARRRVKGRTG